MTTRRAGPACEACWIGVSLACSEEGRVRAAKVIGAEGSGRRGAAECFNWMAVTWEIAVEEENIASVYGVIMELYGSGIFVLHLRATG
jgi:hypothetical protein